MVSGVCCSGFIFQCYCVLSVKVGGVIFLFSGVYQLKWYQNFIVICFCDLFVNYYFINNYVNSVYIEYDFYKVKEFKICNVNDCIGYYIFLFCNFVINVYM